MRLFTVPKIGVYCDAITHRLETRKDRDVKVIDLRLRVQPFTPTHASALDPEFNFVKRLLFGQGGEPLTLYSGIEFKTFSEPQLMTAFASPDTTEASIAFDQVKLAKLRARCQKNVEGWALIIRATFGPVSKAELEYVNAWYTEQRFLSFDPAHPSLLEDDDAPPPARTPPTPMFDTDAAGRPKRAH